MTRIFIGVRIILVDNTLFLKDIIRAACFEVRYPKYYDTRIWKSWLGEINIVNDYEYVDVMKFS